MRFYFIPYQNLDFTVAERPEEVAERIGAWLETQRRVTDPSSVSPAQTMNDPELHVAGDVRGYVITTTSRAFAANTFLPRIRGELIPTAEGTRVQIVFSTAFGWLTNFNLRWLIACWGFLMVLISAAFGNPLMLLYLVAVSPVCIYAIILTIFSLGMRSVLPVIELLFPGCTRGKGN